MTDDSSMRVMIDINLVRRNLSEQLSQDLFRFVVVISFTPSVVLRAHEVGFHAGGGSRQLADFHWYTEISDITSDRENSDGLRSIWSEVNGDHHGNIPSLRIVYSIRV